MPPNTIYVGRPSEWGNPFVCDGDKTAAVAMFERYLKLAKKEGYWFEEYIVPLRGKNLACWCPLDQPCHADVLLRLANEKVKHEA
jgi:hypothetical protein